MPDPLLQRSILSGVMSLPRPILRLIAGGGVVYRGGRTLDPRLQFLAHQARNQPALTSLTPAEARLAFSRALKGVEDSMEPRVGVETLFIDGPGGALSARAYRPNDQDPTAPVLVYAHMGGGVVGDLESCHAFCAILARIARCPVLSVAYSLAPESRFPAGLQDMLDAFRWARSHAGRFGAPAGAAAIGGEGAGGNLAAAVCQALKRHGEPQPAFQLLVYPNVDMASETVSMTTYADAFPLSRALQDWFVGQYMGPGDDPADPRLSPLKEPDLSGLAPAVIATAGFDPLADQGEAYARRLRAAGVKIAFRLYDGLAHGFCAYTGAVPAADQACREVAALVRQAVEGGLA